MSQDPGEQNASNSSSPSSTATATTLVAQPQPQPQPQSPTLSQHHRVVSGSKLSKHRHTRPSIIRTTSSGKLASTTATTANTHETPSTRPTFRRAVSTSLTSPTSPTHNAQAGSRPGNIRRNTSAFIHTKPSNAHAALKKNFSSGHLPRAASSKNVAKKQALPMRRTKSGQSQKSPTVDQHNHQPTVRFNIGVEVAPGDDTDDNEWTEDSTSISPNTTRDHTRSNSVILESNNAMNPLRIALEQASSANQKPVLTADALTSRLLMRNPLPPQTTQQPHHQTPQSSDNSYSVVEQDHISPGSAESRLVGRFVNGSSTPAHSPILTTSKGKQRAEQDEAADDVAHSLDSHRRNKSASQLSRSHLPAANPNLPPSRTQQKLDLQRVSSVLETTKHAVPVPPRPSAPAILRYNAGFGFSEGGHYEAQMQSLFGQVEREYQCVKRFRNPVSESLLRLGVNKNELRKMAKAVATNGTQQTNGHFYGPGTANHDTESSFSSPEKSQKRKNRVSFEIPSKPFDDDEDEDDDEGIQMSQGKHTAANHHHRPHHTSHRPRERLEAIEICKRMWELDAFTGSSLE